MNASLLKAGAAQVDITPHGSPFLWGYPHVARYATGVHDPLYTSALCLQSGDQRVVFIANDLILITREQAASVRKQIEAATGIPAAAIMITATHTHSGPATVTYLSNMTDPIVPPLDEGYLHWMVERIVRAAVQASEALQPAEAGWACADATGIGTNRLDPAGPAILDVPVLMLRTLKNARPLACMLVCSMHPTVLHEDSTLISGDFPGLARRRIQAGLGVDCPVLHHSGPAGNLSPRHVINSYTFSEADRIGAILADAVLAAIQPLRFQTELPLQFVSRRVEARLRTMPTVEAALAAQAATQAQHAALVAGEASVAAIRTAECALFGAEETLALARAAQDGRLGAVAALCSPAEIQVIAVGPWIFLAWPGEFFVEYGLQVLARHPDVALITLANGELQGYIVTPEAIAAQTYEAGNALFDADNGPLFVEQSLELLAEIKQMATSESSAGRL